MLRRAGRRSRREFAMRCISALNPIGRSKRRHLALRWLNSVIYGSRKINDKRIMFHSIMLHYSFSSLWKFIHFWLFLRGTHRMSEKLCKMVREKNKWLGIRFSFWPRTFLVEMTRWMNGRCLRNSLKSRKDGSQVICGSAPTTIRVAQVAGYLCCHQQ